MVSTKINNNKTSLSTVPSAEWNWIGDIFNSTTQNTSFNIGSGSMNVGAIYSTATIDTTVVFTQSGVVVPTISSTSTLSNKTLSATTMSSYLSFNNNDIYDVSVASFRIYNHGNTSTATTITWDNGSYQTCTLTGNCTIAFVAPTIPATTMARLTLMLQQDNVGSRTVTWPSTVRWSGSTAPTLTTTGTIRDAATFIYNGSQYLGVMSTNIPQ
jgi:hypothetical protein